MKKLLLTLSFASLVVLGNAQASLYQNLKKLIAEQHPELATENKLIAFNVWSMNDATSRETNKAFEKTVTVYEHARLKGGSRGLIVLAVNTDNLSPDAVISVTKDGISKMISVKLSDLQGIGEGTVNSVFDSEGTEVYRNLAPEAVYSSINQLITR